jgi:ABC-type transporter Mla MlaB component
MPDPADANWPLRLPADCSIGAIRGVHESVREAFHRQQRLEIDCSGVDKADVTSVQLLLSTAKTGKAQGRQVVLKALSNALRTTLRRAGFASEEAVEFQFQQRKEDV